MLVLVPAVRPRSSLRLVAKSQLAMHTCVGRERRATKKNPGFNC